MSTITTGNIQPRQTKHGRKWQIVVDLPHAPVTGKRIRKFKTVGGTKKEAERAMREFIRELERGYHVTDDHITVSEWIATWLEVFITPNVSPTTLSRYTGMIRRYITPLIGSVKVQELKPLTVQSWVNSLSTSPVSGKKLSASTIKHTYHILKGAMDKAVQAGSIPVSPCTGIMLPKGQKKKAVIYDEAQIQCLIQTAKGTEMELVIDMELCLGLRRGELLGLQWCDVDWVNNRISVVRNRVLVDGEVIVKEPKTESGIRTLDVPAQLMEELKRHKTECAKRRLKLGQTYTVTDYIIVHPDGKPIYPEYLTQMFTKLLKKAGLPKCRFHDLRHLCASIMLRQNVNVKIAQELLGHKDITTTLNIYSHVMPSSAKDAAEKIAELVYGSISA